MQLIGYYVRLQTDSRVPPVCAVLSEMSLDLVVFPFQDEHQNEAVDALVLPPIPLFLEATCRDTGVVFYQVNRYLLALLLLCTREDVNLYMRKDGFQRKRETRAGAVKKSLLKNHIRTRTEQLQADLKAEREERQRAEQERQRAEQERDKALKRAQEAERRERDMFRKAYK